jgi:hypothetical protein
VLASPGLHRSYGRHLGRGSALLAGIYETASLLLISS